MTHKFFLEDRELIKHLSETMGLQEDWIHDLLHLATEKYSGHSSSEQIALKEEIEKIIKNAIRQVESFE